MNDKIDENTVRKVAKLSRLALADDEIHQFADQLNAVLEYIEKLNELDTDAVEPLAHCLPVKNVLRPDEIRDSLGTDKALANAPQRDENHFIVPKILDEVSA